MKTVHVPTALKGLNETFLTRKVVLERVVRRGDNWIWRQAPVKVVDFEGVTIEYIFLLKLLEMFKRTRVHTVEVKKCQDGLRITFGRATYLLKGIGDG